MQILPPQHHGQAHGALMDPPPAVKETLSPCDDPGAEREASFAFSGVMHCTPVTTRVWVVLTLVAHQSCLDEDWIAVKNTNELSSQQGMGLRVDAHS